MRPRLVRIVARLACLALAGSVAASAAGQVVGVGGASFVSTGPATASGLAVSNGGWWWPGAYGGFCGSPYGWGGGWNGGWGGGLVQFGRLNFPASTTFVVTPTRTVIWPGPDETREAPETEPTPPPSPLEKGWLWLAAGEPDRAVEAFAVGLSDGDRDDTDGGRARSSDKNAPDTPGKAELLDARRGLGLALVAADRPDDGAAVLRSVYVEAPGLAGAGLSPADLGGPLAARAALRIAMRHAQDVDSASAWLAVVAVMQAEGRDRVARRMLDRAGRRSLEPEIVLAFRAALDG